MNMNPNKQTVTCPKCTHQFNADEVLSRQIEDKLRQSFEAQSAQNQAQFEYQLKAEKAQYEQLSTKIHAQKLQIDFERQSMQTHIAEAVQQGVKRERAGLEQSLTARITANVNAENSDRFQAMENELNHKSEQVKELSKAKAEISRLSREKEEGIEAAKAEAELKSNQRLREERLQFESQAEIRLREERSQADMKLRDREYEIDKLKHQIQEAQRVSEQGSTQAQGEVQELAIEEWLRNSFLLDEIKEIPKGQRGADCVQIVNTRTHYNCGKICYESKRTENFNKEWIEKFKADIRTENATIGVLVTKTMPKNMERMGLFEDIWICTFEEFKGLSAVLRESIIQINSLIATQENKGEKKEMLYNFVTSNAFTSRLSDINETFNQMREELRKERAVMQRSWVQREKQIEKLELNTINIGEIEGIIGRTIQGEVQLEPSLPVVESIQPVLVSPPIKPSSAGIKQDSLF
jgi:hypothetical protein